MTKSHSGSASPYQRIEGSFNSFDSTKIFYQGWKASGSIKSKATVLITHGQGEHSESYHRVISHFANKGYDFWAWDMRGHGRSEGIRGYAKSFQDYIQDYGLFLDLILQKIDRNKPLFLMAHSMGGLVQISELIKRNQGDFKAQTLSAPLLGVAVEVPAFKKHGAEILEKLLPKLALGNEIDNTLLTREPEVMREFDKDSLRHNKISSGVYLGFLRQIEKIKSQFSEIKIPTLFQCPEKDPVCSTEATKKMSDSMNADLVKFLIYGDGARHEMFNDLNRDEVFKDLEGYLESQLKESK
jgi:alpha-beta hydrolase superfamily lysophospholipase